MPLYRRVLVRLGICARAHIRIYIYIYLTAKITIEVECVCDVEKCFLEVLLICLFLSRTQIDARRIIIVN